MKKQIEQPQSHGLDPNTRIRHYLWFAAEVERRQHQLMQKKENLFRRVDALEAQLQALKKRRSF
ncbi:hypothetical protein [Spirosoma oryzicola]|uniref:hypothetical protein n=1 Tax=Spirosoma oryzicola TaxID=2898794 RepID=UPI001E5F118C|nr:hypothetical protein [Spirosoma oryzicola]UHG94965.1 hypothetical protein LQ777_30495 [Spirosoma oryzicola]